MSRALVIGLDGMPLSLTRRLGDDGVLPCLSGLLTRGSTAELVAPVPEVSSTSWATFLTGVNPGRHGIYGFTDLRRRGRMMHDDIMASDTKHLSERIDRPADEVYKYASDPARLPEWAPGLGTAVEKVGDQWFVDTPMGRVTFAFAPPNDFGILDHDVTLPSGEVIYNPMRVTKDGSGSEVVFSLRRLPGMTDAEFERDAKAVADDLTRLKNIVESH